MKHKRIQPKETYHVLEYISAAIVTVLNKVAEISLAVLRTPKNKNE